MGNDNAVLILQDGTLLKGTGFGSKDIAEGEVVFNTSMTGYQEALTDPSYKYQILMILQLKNMLISKQLPAYTFMLL